MYEVYFHAGKDVTPLASEALSRAIASAVQGREATVVDERSGVVWFVEVDSKPTDNSSHPAIVHFRGASVEQAAADLMVAQLPY